MLGVHVLRGWCYPKYIKAFLSCIGTFSLLTSEMVFQLQVFTRAKDTVCKSTRFNFQHRKHLIAVLSSGTLSMSISCV